MNLTSDRTDDWKETRRKVPTSDDDFELEFIKSSFQSFRKEGNDFFGYIDGSDEKINLFVGHFMFLTSICLAQTTHERLKISYSCTNIPIFFWEIRKVI